MNYIGQLFRFKKSENKLTLDTSGYAENDKNYTHYKKLKELEGINCIKIPGHERSFMFNKMDFESKVEICRDTRFIVEHYLYKPTNTEMAVKFLRIPFANDVNKFETFFNKIQREIKTCKEFSPSPNLVELYGFCIYGGYILICMEYMDMSLYDLYKQFHQQHGRFPKDLLGIIAVSVVDALKDLKSKSIMHRNIKPQNILINKQGQIKLCYFGVSRILVDSLTTTVNTGTVLYWPPERFDMSSEDDKYDIRADIWSLGITLMEISKGEHPIEIDEANPFSLKEPFNARPSSTQLISSNLYIEYKEITQAIVVETILVFDQIVDVQQEQLINNIKRALIPLKNCTKFKAELVIRLIQILQESHFEIDANASYILKHISIIESLIAICEEITDSYKAKLSKSGIYDTLLLIIEKSMQIQGAYNNEKAAYLLEKAACLLQLIVITEENKQILLKNQKWNDILLSCFDWKLASYNTITYLLAIYSNKLYIEYKEITQAIVETILVFDQIVDVQQEQLIKNIKRALILLKNCPKFKAGLAIHLIQILLESHFEIDVNASGILKLISIIEALSTICNTDSYKIELCKSGIHDIKLVLSDKMVTYIHLNFVEMLEILEWNDILLSCFNWKLTSHNTKIYLLIIYGNLPCSEKMFDNIVLLHPNAIKCIWKISLKFINSDEVPFSILAVQNLINLLKNYRRHLNLFSKNMKFDQEQMTSLIIKHISSWKLNNNIYIYFSNPAFNLTYIQREVQIPVKLYFLWRLANETLIEDRRETACRELYEKEGIKLSRQVIEDRQITKLGKSLAELILLNIQTWKDGRSFEENEKLADKITPCSVSAAYELAYPE